ncbi:hypothetical protein E2C01_054516 [Portunus trituberculatus]|uniref:Uncharacterized protein n=1 Tax=Portunus trituberculatus TaxID=210409 RepID=A0A5B7GK24_PORTR|nr:hypothetical protein [Portunus trituberculatus]
MKGDRDLHLLPLSRFECPNEETNTLTNIRVMYECPALCPASSQHVASSTTQPNPRDARRYGPYSETLCSLTMTVFQGHKVDWRAFQE